MNEYPDPLNDASVNLDNEQETLIAAVTTDYVNSEISLSELEERVEYIIDHGEDPADLRNGELLLREIKTLLREKFETGYTDGKIIVTADEYYDLQSELDRVCRIDSFSSFPESFTIFGVDVEGRVDADNTPKFVQN